MDESREGNPPKSSSSSGATKRRGERGNVRALRQFQEKLAAAAALKSAASGTGAVTEQASGTAAKKTAVPKPKPVAPSPVTGLWSQKFGSPVPEAAPEVKPATVAPSQLHDIFKQRFGGIVPRPIATSSPDKTVKVARRQQPIMALFRQAIASRPPPVAGTPGAGKGASEATMELFRKLKPARASHVSSKVSRSGPRPGSLSVYENVRAVFFSGARVKDSARIKLKLRKSVNNSSSGWLRKTPPGFALRQTIISYLNPVPPIYRGVKAGARKLNPGPALRRGAARVNPGPFLGRQASGQLPYVVILCTCMISMSIVADN